MACVVNFNRRSERCRQGQVPGWPRPIGLFSAHSIAAMVAMAGFAAWLRFPRCQAHVKHALAALAMTSGARPPACSVSPRSRSGSRSWTTHSATARRRQNSSASTVTPSAIGIASARSGMLPPGAPMTMVRKSATFRPRRAIASTPTTWAKPPAPSASPTSPSGAWTMITPAAATGRWPIRPPTPTIARRTWRLPAKPGRASAARTCWPS